MSRKVRGALLGYLIIFAGVALLFEKIGRGWLWAILAAIIIGVIIKAFSSHSSKVPTGEFGRSKKSEKRGSSQTYRDYGREAMAGPHYNDVIKSIRLSCALDERTCLKCLELDGTEAPPKLPIHEGCRCVTVPVTKTWKELGVKHPPYIDMAETTDGACELYKAYLIERAKALEKDLEGEALAHHLRTILPSLKKRYPKEVDSFAIIKAKVFVLQPSDDPAELEDILRNLTWPFDEFGPLFKCCVEFEKFSLIDRTLRRLLKQVPSVRHKGMLCRAAGDSVKTVSLEKAVEYYERAENIDKENTAIMMELGKLYRRTKRFDEAKRMFERVLTIKPNHKEAKREIAKL